jgi:hypothetical protein
VPPSDASNRRRSERVMLQIPVKVLAETVDRAQVQEETHTLVVNAHGGLLKLKAELLVGQPIVLVNPQSGMEQSCRVVRIDQAGSGSFAVAFEFDRPSPKFWPVVFPPKASATRFPTATFQCKQGSIKRRTNTPWRLVLCGFRAHSKQPTVFYMLPHCFL